MKASMPDASKCKDTRNSRVPASRGTSAKAETPAKAGTSTTAEMFATARMRACAGDDIKGGRDASNSRNASKSRDARIDRCSITSRDASKGRDFSKSSNNWNASTCRFPAGLETPENAGMHATAETPAVAGRINVKSGHRRRAELKPSLRHFSIH